MRQTVTAELLAFFVIFLVIAFGFSAHAQPIHQFRIAPGFTYIDYNEPNMTEEGTLVGVGMDYKYVRPESFFFNANFTIHGGGLDYDGQTLEQNPRPISLGTDNDLVEPSVRFGHHFRYYGGSMMPYLGIGYRRWNNLIGSNTDRVVEYYYSPIGIYFVPSNSSKWKVIGQFEYMHLWRGDVATEFRAQSENADNRQNHGRGLRAKMNLSNSAFLKGFDLEVHLTHWDIDQSEQDNINIDFDRDGSTENVPVVEPENDTMMIGVRANFVF